MRRAALITLPPTARALLRDWRTATLVVFSIALAIAVNSTVVSLLEALIYPRMDMKAPDRLYWVDFYGDYKHQMSDAKRDTILSRHAAGFSITTWADGRENGVVLENGDRFTSVRQAVVGPAFFELAGITPLSGRVPTPQDTSASPAVVALSETVASQLFGSESPIGQIIKFQGQRRRVVGVLGELADFPNTHAGVWTFGGDPEPRTRLIRIRDGYSGRDVARALDSAAVVVAALVHERPQMDVAFRIKPAVQTQFHYEHFHYAIGAACLALLLIACANAANLEMARAIGRRRQLAIKSALGASPIALIRDVLEEEALLATIATGAALALTYVGSRVLYELVPPSVGEFVIHPHVGWRVVTFAAIVAAVATLLVGCAPAIRSARADPQEALKDGAGTGRTHRRYYATLVTLELGFAIALTCGAIVMMRATAAFDARPIGVDLAPLIAGSLSDQRVVSARESMDALSKRLASVDGVASAAVSLSVQVRNNSVTVDDSLGTAIEVPAPLVHYLIVTPRYLQTLGIPIALGATFDPSDMKEPQVIIDRKTAERLWPGRDAIGQRVKLGAPASKLAFARVVGVIEGAPDSTRRNVLGPLPPEHTLGGIFYLPIPNDPLTATRLQYRQYEFIVRAKGDAPPVVMAIRRALIRVENAAFARVDLMDNVLGTSKARASRVFLMQLFAFFALCGITLSGIAVFSIIARSVTERRRELSVRRALGARTHEILHTVLRETVPVALLGVALGLALTKYAIPLLGSQALPDDRFNAPLYALTSVLVTIVLTASLAVPAFRATRVPMSEALRSS
jgi:putative ABC transport system permease protein